jgi:hypothetical protein
MVVILFSLQDSAQRNNYFRGPAESGGEVTDYRLPVLPKSRLRVEGNKREQTFPSDGGIYPVILCLFFDPIFISLLVTRLSIYIWNRMLLLLE